MNPAVWMVGLGRASLEAAVLLIAIGTLLRFVPRTPPGTRATLWWLASLRALTGCLGLPGVPLPLLPAKTLSVLPAAPQMAATAADAQVAHQIVGGSASLAPAMAADPLWIAAQTLGVVWCAGFVTMALRHSRDVKHVLDLWRGAAPLASPRLLAWLEHWLGATGAARVELRTSEAVRAPLLLGWGRARILLPGSFVTDAVPVARMALAHEAGHLLRRDLWLGWVPALAECVFWFHPIVRWGVREYAQAREEACDAHALRLTGAEPAGYGEMLVGFGVDRSRVGHAAASCGSPHARHLKRRLHMLSLAGFQSPAQRAFSLAIVIAFGALALVPMRLVAADPGAPPAPPAPAGTSAPPPPTHTPPAVAPAPPPPAPAASAASHEGDDRSDHDAQFGADDDDSFSVTWSIDDHDREFSYGLLTDGNQTFSGTFGEKDWARLNRLHEDNPGRIFWFSLKGKDYVVRDQATWREVNEILRPQRELGARQAALGAKQNALGERQAALGAQQAELGAHQAELSGEVSLLSMRLEDTDSRSDARAIRARIRDLQHAISDLGRRQAELGSRQSELGSQQSRLGRQQGELGRQQSAEAERARSVVRRLAERCIRDGRAKRWDG